MGQRPPLTTLHGGPWGLEAGVGGVWVRDPPPGGPFWAAMVNGGLGGGCVARSPPTAHPAAPLLVLPWVRAPQ